jgi:hypothetical protein
VERHARLLEREVECGAVEGPPAVEPRDLGLRRDREQVEPVRAVTELRQREPAGEVLCVYGPRGLQRQVVLGLVDDVLADALDPGAL